MSFVFDTPGYPICDPLAEFIDGPASTLREFGDTLVGVVSRSIAGRSAACTIPGLPADERLPLRLRIDVGSSPGSYSPGPTSKSGDLAFEGIADLRLAKLNPCLARVAGVPAGNPAANDWNKALAATPIWESEAAMGSLKLTASPNESGVILSEAFDPIELLIALRRRARALPTHRIDGWTWSKRQPLPPLVLDSSGRKVPSLSRSAQSVLGVNGRAAVEPVLKERRICAASEVWSAAGGRSGDGLAYAPAYGDTPTRFRRWRKGRESISLSWLHIDDGSAPWRYNPNLKRLVAGAKRSLRPFVLGGTTAHFAAAVGAPMRCVSGALLPLVGTSGELETQLLADGLRGAASHSAPPYGQWGREPQSPWNVPQPGALQVLLSGGIALLEARVEVRVRHPNGSSVTIAKRVSSCLVRDPAQVQYVVAHGGQQGELGANVSDVVLGSLGPKSKGPLIPICRVSMWLRSSMMDANATAAPRLTRRATPIPKPNLDIKGSEESVLWRRRPDVVVLLACNLGHPLEPQVYPLRGKKNAYTWGISTLMRLAQLFEDHDAAPFGAFAALPSQWVNLRRWLLDQTPRSLPVGLVGPGSMVHSPWTAAGFGSAVLELLALSESTSSSQAWSKLRDWCWSMSATTLPQVAQGEESSSYSLVNFTQLAPVVISRGKILASTLYGRLSDSMAKTYPEQNRYSEDLLNLPEYDAAEVPVEEIQGSDWEGDPDGAKIEADWRHFLDFCRARRALLDKIWPNRSWLACRPVAEWQREAAAGLQQLH